MKFSYCYILTRKKFIVYSFFAILIMAAVFKVSYYIGTVEKNKNNLVVNNGHNSVKPLIIEVNKKKFKTANITPQNIKETKIIINTDEKQAVSNIYKNDGHKVAYLTFDDGPSPNITPQILGILKNENVKATFFIIGKNAESYPWLLKEEKEEGHEIAIHSYCHIYNIIYANQESLLYDLNRCSKVIGGIVGTDGFNSKLIRFPGGSSNALKYNKAYLEITEKSGYSFVDWNDEIGDAKANMGPASPEVLFNNFKHDAAKSHLVILMHDAPDKKNTVLALPVIIHYLKGEGYSFKVIP